ncbi:MAG: putative oxidoreductase C-terminal domain-containing protein [Planctomycetota bacterium]
MGDEQVFGELEKGTASDPAFIQKSVHHFFKMVAGNPIKRPGWFFDTEQQGDGTGDVITHLTDLAMWELFSEEPIDYTRDVEVKKADRWATLMTKEDFEKVTRLSEWPVFLKEKLDGTGNFPCYANGEIVFAVRGVHAKVTAIWDFEAPKGAGDTHYSMVRGTKAIVSILQGQEQEYKPELYVEARQGTDIKKTAEALNKAIEKIQSKYTGVQIRSLTEGRWQIIIPEKYRIGHETHFAQVTERYLNYLTEGTLPRWETENIKSKYYVSATALEMAKKKEA